MEYHTFRIPVELYRTGEVKIKAKSYEEAVEKVNENWGKSQKM